jgi:pSer/pThr/pTyr-binding forkhead associated (FHA) protein
MAAKLILSMDGAVMHEYVLNKERMTVGRKPHNDIVIDNLAVSGEHAAIVTILNDSFLEDLDSTNGVMVNGVPAKKHFLQNNDVVEIGKYKLKYMNETQGQATGSDFEKTMVLRSPAMQGNATQANAPRINESGADGRMHSQTQNNLQPSAPREVTGRFAAVTPQGFAPQQVGMSTVAQKAYSQPLAPVQQPAAPVQQPVAPVQQPVAPVQQPVAPVQQPVALVQQPAPGVPPATVQILTGPNAGRELDLVKNLTTLGKPGVQVAVLTRRPHGYFITHVEGTHYPALNGKMLDEQPHQLNNHDIIELAGVKMEFYFKD